MKLPIRIDPELAQAPPRRVLLSGAGRRTFLAWTIPIAGVLALTAGLFFARPQPRWVTALFALALAAGLVALWRLLSLWQARAALVRSGIASPAVVIWKEKTRLGATHYYAWYQAGGRQWGIGFSGERDDAQIGDAVTVLHEPDRPGQAVVYRGSGCAAKPLTPSI